MKRSRYLLIMILLLTGSCLAAWAFAGNVLFRSSTPVIPEETKVPVADPRLLKELATVYAQMNGKEWAMEGVVVLTDGANPDESMPSTAFSYRQNGKLLYYKLGQMEIVNLEDCYIVMQHEAKKILVSAPKEITQAPYLPLETLVKMTSEEEYNVTRKTSGGTATISLARENHITCKEYAISFDTTSLQLSNIRTRLTNLDAPADTAKDKVMEVNITSWPVHGNKEYLNKHRYIQGTGDSYIPAAAYQDYQLIRL